jgi:DNA primase large subunit
MATIAESVSRVRGIIKGTNEDSFLTDRFVYSIISKYAKALMRREQIMSKLMQNEDLFSSLTFVELIDVNKIEAECSPIKSNCTIKRTLYKLPKLFNGTKGPLIRRVYSIDQGFEFHKTSPTTYISIANKTSFKYDKNKYYWFKNGYLYLPDTETEGIMVEALWEDVLSGFCSTDENDCSSIQERIFPLPDYLFAEVEQMAQQEFGISIRIPDDGADDGQNVLRQ